jgi:hypothetical protein
MSCSVDVVDVAQSRPPLTWLSGRTFRLAKERQELRRTDFITGCGILLARCRMGLAALVRAGLFSKWALGLDVRFVPDGRVTEFGKRTAKSLSFHRFKILLRRAASTRSSWLPARLAASCATLHCYEDCYATNEKRCSSGNTSVTP